MTENEHITDVEDMNDDAGNGNDFGDDADRTDDIGDDVDQTDDIGDDETVHHGEIVTAEDAENALTANGGADAFYAGLGSDVVSELRDAAASAKLKMHDARDIASEAVRVAAEAGRILNRVRGLLDHGKWNKWLKVEFGQTDRTARNFMSLAIAADTARELSGPEGEEKILALPQKLSYSIGTDNLPKEERTAIVSRIVSGELDKPKEIKDVVTDVKAEVAARKAEAEAGKGKKASGGEGGEEGEGDGETFAEKKKKYAAALRKLSAFNLAVSMVAAGDETEEDNEAPTASDIVAAFAEIGSGSKGKMTAEDHVMFSEMLAKVAAGWDKGGRDAVDKMKPVIPPEPVAKAKKGKKSDPAE